MDQSGFLLRYWYAFAHYLEKKMGGPNSGRKPTNDRKQQVENCAAIKISRLAEEGVFSHSESVFHAILFNALPVDHPNFYGQQSMVVATLNEPMPHFTITFMPEAFPGEVVQTIYLTGTGSKFGGKKPYFLCGGREGSQCDKKVDVLYLPPFSEQRLACRSCHNLAYRSEAKRGSFSGTQEINASISLYPADFLPAEKRQGYIEMCVKDVRKLLGRSGLLEGKAQGTLFKDDESGFRSLFDDTLPEVRDANEKIQRFLEGDNA